MTQMVTSRPVPRDTDSRPRQRQAQRLAVAVLLGLTAASCAGADMQQEAYRGDDVPFWHEEEQRDDSAGGDSAS